MEQANVIRRRVDRSLSRPMTVLAGLFVMTAALVLPIPTQSALPMTVRVWAGAVAISAWAVFVVEGVLRLVWLDAGIRGWRRVGHVMLVMLVPPLRTGLRPATARGFVWLPGAGWRKIGRGLYRRVERVFSVPMILIALLILPVLALEFLWKEQVAAHWWLAVTLDGATRLIWLAFAVEFVVMLAATRRKVGYCVEHWLDLAIILLPVVSFLRALRVLRLGRVMRAGRVGQMARTYRLRGLAMRAYRALLLLKVFESLSGRLAERRIASLQKKISGKEREIEELKEEISALHRLAERQREAEGASEERGES